MPSSVATPAPAPAYTVTDEQVRFFVQQGYLVVPGLVSPADIERLKQDTLALARGKYPCETLKPLPADLSDQQVLENLLCIHQPHYISPVMREFVAHPGIAAVLSRVVGAHLPFWDGSVKCMQSMLFVKPPGKQGQSWHQDEYYIPTRDRSLCGAWIAIDDATVANGCLRIIPGSHRTGYIHPWREHGNLREYDGPQEMHGFDTANEVIVEVPAGSVVFFNGYTLHRSTKNRSRIYRRALVNHYMNAWSQLPWYNTEGGHGHVGTADNRTIVPISGTDPYAWKGTVTTDQGVWLRGYDRDGAKPEA